MAFADAFTAENIGNLLNDPRMVMAMHMLGQSGYQQGNPGFGARMGQALGGAATQIQQAQHSQQLNAYRQQMAQMQAQQMAMQQQTAQAKADQQRQYQERLQDPAFLQSLTPMARQMAALGVDPSDLIRAQSADNLQAHRQATLTQQAAQFDARLANHGAGGGQSSGPRMPAPRPYIDQPVGNNQMQRFKYDAELQDYTPWGKPFSQFSPGRKATGADAAVDAILNPEQPVDEPDVSSLPGSGGLQSYAPQPQGPVGVLPMTAAGSVPGANKPGTRKPGQPKIATPMTKADYDALPVGAQYIDPASGKTAIKRG